MAKVLAFHGFIYMPFDVALYGRKYGGTLLCLQILQMEQKGSLQKLFSQNDIGSTLYNTHELTRDGVFGETNFMEVPKIHEIRKLYKRVPYGITQAFMLCLIYVNAITLRH